MGSAAHVSPRCPRHAMVPADVEVDRQTSITTHWHEYLSRTSTESGGLVAPAAPDDCDSRGGGPEKSGVLMMVSFEIFGRLTDKLLTESCHPVMNGVPTLPQ
ncbi:hypothetical protein AN958_00579 [Leucoagaricus sp. SymC.cos]|nr:hypothetical protein AN958_00579 [Leucoagaricus sp. SymC.cos]